MPDNNGNIPEWKHLAAERPAGVERAASGRGPGRARPGRDPHRRHDDRAGSSPAQRGRTSRPQAPFFQLGLVGATVPALKIDGEIGQQLGYLAANTVGVIDFVILLLVGWAFAHKEKVAAGREWLKNRRAASPGALGRIAQRDRPRRERSISRG